MAKLTKIQGIEQKHADILRSAGIRTTGALSKYGATPEGRKDIAKSTGLSQSTIRRWVSEIDLYRVTGIGPEYAELIEKVGVHSVGELANQDPEELYRALARFNRELGTVRKLPTRYQIQGWVKQARRLPELITID